MSTLGSEASGSHSNLVWQRFKSEGALHRIIDSQCALLNMFYRALNRPKGILEPYSTLCMFVRWGEWIALLPEGTEKETGGCCYCYYLHYHNDQYWIYPLMADIFSSICKQSTVHSHLTYKQRVKELQSSG